MDTDTSQTMERAREALIQGDIAAAGAFAAQALAAGRDDLEVRQYLGYAARTRNDLDDAATHYAAALRHAPTDGAIHNNLAETRHAQKNYAEALALYRRAALLAPDKAEIAANLGGLLLGLHRPDDALPHLQRALSIDPNLINANGDAGSTLCALNRYAESLPYYRALHRVQPNNNSARYLEALAMLALGDFDNGWRKHECRWYATLGQDLRQVLPEPYWLGEDDIAGQTILLHAEQGMGDTIQFVRFAPLVAARGARVIVAVQSPLAPLIRTMPGIDAVIARGDPVPRYDMQSSLMSMPRAFRTRLDTIPAATPYLTAPPGRSAQWHQRLGRRDGRCRIAIAWSGTQTVWNRPVALAVMEKLLRRPDCIFHVAQTEILPDDLNTLAAMPHIQDHSLTLTDFADTAGLLSQMDLVISVDTVLAHLGGALALPTWTLLPFGADYRWLTEGTTSPWYPGMRLFRQPAFGDWNGLIAAVGQALDAHLA